MRLQMSAGQNWKKMRVIHGKRKDKIAVVNNDN